MFSSYRSQFLDIQWHCGIYSRCNSNRPQSGVNVVPYLQIYSWDERTFVAFKATGLIKENPIQASELTEKASIVIGNQQWQRGGSHPISLLGRNVTETVLLLQEVSDALVPRGDTSRHAYRVGSRIILQEQMQLEGSSPLVCAVTSTPLAQQPGATSAVTRGTSSRQEPGLCLSSQKEMHWPLSCC